ncbi:pseudouridine synthase [Paenibacillus darwinianus]|nr:pseudouridine synthase [Paenibacillus darwinianus]
MTKRMRLDKMLANMGCGTRSEIKTAVRQGKVTVGGFTVQDSGLQIDPEADEVEFDGQKVRFREVVYLLMNKPQGVVSATEDTRERTVLDLLKPEDRVLQPFPAGRLDKDTVGLLLLTNDGRMAHELLSPRKHVDKTYEALVSGTVDEADRQAFAAGVTLDDGYVTMPAELTVLRTDAHFDAGTEPVSEISLTIREGKFHQVKRMFEAVGKKVLFLKRVAMGPLKLDERLAPGSYRELSAEELEALKSLKSHRGRGR